MYEDASILYYLALEENLGKKEEETTTTTVENRLNEIEAKMIEEEAKEEEEEEELFEEKHEEQEKKYDSVESSDEEMITLNMICTPIANFELVVPSSRKVEDLMGTIQHHIKKAKGIGICVYNLILKDSSAVSKGC